MSLNFVNIHGQPVSTAPVKAPPKSKADSGPNHKGWVVVGFSPEHIEEGRRAHEASNPDRPFVEADFLRTAKPKAATKPFAIGSAAEVAKNMLVKQGWKLVQVVPKGKAS